MNTETNEELVQVYLTRSIKANDHILGYGSRNNNNGSALITDDMLELITDLRHLCDIRKIDFFQILDLSYLHYCDERNSYSCGDAVTALEKHIMARKFKEAHKPVCNYCGSTELSFEPMGAGWDPKTQRFEIMEVCDKGHSCICCGSDEVRFELRIVI